MYRRGGRELSSRSERIPTYTVKPLHMHGPWTASEHLNPAIPPYIVKTLHTHGTQTRPSSPRNHKPFFLFTIVVLLIVFFRFLFIAVDRFYSYMLFRLVLLLLNETPRMPHSADPSWRSSVISRGSQISNRADLRKLGKSKQNVGGALAMPSPIPCGAFAMAGRVQTAWRTC